MNHMQHLFSSPSLNLTPVTNTLSSTSLDSESSMRTVAPEASSKLSKEIERKKKSNSKKASKDVKSLDESKGELEYVITPEVIINLKQEFLDKPYESLGGRKRSKSESEALGEELFPLVPRIEGKCNMYVSRMRLSSDPTGIDRITAENGATRRIHDEDEVQADAEQEHTERVIIRHFPLASSGLDIAMKIRCVDISLNLIQQYSDLKNKINAASFSVLSSIKADTDNGSVPSTTSVKGTGTFSAPVPVPVPAIVPVSPPFDASLPQAVCQLLVHLTRDRLIRDHFEGCGGVHRLITCIPPFEGKNSVIPNITLKSFPIPLLPLLL